MKKILVFLIAFSFITFQSCSDDDSKNVPTASIVGEWKLIDLRTENGTMNIDVSGVKFNGSYELVGTEYNDSNIVFKENPNTVTSSGNITVKATTTIMGQTQSQSQSSSFDNISGTWSVENNILKTTTEKGTDEITIDTLNEKNLILKTSLDKIQGVDLSQMGAIEITGYVYLKFERK